MVFFSYGRPKSKLHRHKPADLRRASRARATQRHRVDMPRRGYMALGPALRPLTRGAPRAPEPHKAPKTT